MLHWHPELVFHQMISCLENNFRFIVDDLKSSPQLFDPIDVEVKVTFLWLRGSKTNFRDKHIILLHISEKWLFGDRAFTVIDVVFFQGLDV